MTPAGLDRLRLDEGLRLVAYRDQGGVLTIGYGHTGKDVREGMTISRIEADAFLEHDVSITEAGLRKLAWTGALDPVRFDVLTNIGFNVGVNELLHWPKTLGHFAAHDWPAAANDLLHEGKWNDDVGKRAVRLANVTAAGTWDAA
jgi:GH24 family phage-related lysozyme (muramidase)